MTVKEPKKEKEIGVTNKWSEMSAKKAMRWFSVER